MVLVREPTLYRLQFHRKAGAWPACLVAEVSAEAAQDKARNVQPHPRALRAFLKRLEQVLRIPGSRTGIAEPHHEFARLYCHRDPEFGRSAFLYGAMTILRQIQECLEQPARLSDR